MIITCLLATLLGLGMDGTEGFNGAVSNTLATGGLVASTGAAATSYFVDRERHPSIRTGLLTGAAIGATGSLLLAQDKGFVAKETAEIVLVGAIFCGLVKAVTLVPSGYRRFSQWHNRPAARRAAAVAHGAGDGRAHGPRAKYTPID